MRWSESDLQHFESRRSRDGNRATVRRNQPNKRSPNAPSELVIHIGIAQHLRHRAATGLWWTHPANGEKRDARDGAKLKVMGMRPGTPDLILVHRGKFFGLELKRHDGRLSAEQQAARAEIEAAGGFWACAWGVDEALAILAEWGLLKPDAGAPATRHAHVADYFRAAHVLPVVAKSRMDSTMAKFNALNQLSVSEAPFPPTTFGRLR